MMKNLRINKISFMLVCFLTTIWASAQSQLYVSASGIDVGNCGSSGSACATINYAVSQASSGDTININGSLSQQSTSTISKSVAIKGAGVGSTTIRVPENSQLPVFTVTANNVAFLNMTLSNKGTMNGGIWIQGATSELTVKSVTFDSLGKVVGSTAGTAGSGIRFLNAFTNTTIESCIFNSYNAKTSVGVTSPGSLITNMLIKNSQFNKLFIGVWSAGSINGLTLTGNTFGPFDLSDATSGSAAVYLGDVTGSIQNVKVENNNFTDFTRGFYINSYSTAGMPNSLVKNIEILNNTFENSIYSSAIRIITSADATIENLRIVDNIVNQSTVNNFTDELSNFFVFVVVVVRQSV